jgi:hypothetical protein
VIPLVGKRGWNQRILSGVIWLSAFGLLVTATPQSPSGGVSGTIRKIIYDIYDKAVPLVGARVEVRNVSNDRDEHVAVTDEDGQYKVDLADGTYKMHFSWQGGDCSAVRRALRLGSMRANI